MITIILCEFAGKKNFFFFFKCDVLQVEYVEFKHYCYMCCVYTQLMRNIGGMLCGQQDRLSVQWRSEELGCLEGGGTLLQW